MSEHEPTADDEVERADDRADEQDLAAVQATLDRVREEMAKRVVGQRDTVHDLLVCLLCDGNALLESNPGLAKTLMVRTLAAITDLEYSRIQSTPDLMPADITGTEIVREVDGGLSFTFEQGPVFANVVLADEVNRATPKTQAALLEAMEERQVTVGSETYALPSPFFLLATQNPIDQEGVYPLPEAQADRFMLKILVDYPSADEEVEVVDRYTKRAGPIPVAPVFSSSALLRAQELVRQVPVADDLVRDAVDLVRRTRDADAVEFGASPRASMGLVRAAKATAFLDGRTHVRPEDVERMAPAVLRHRILLDFRAEREGLTPDAVVQQLL